MSLFNGMIYSETNNYTGFNCLLRVCIIMKAINKIKVLAAMALMLFAGSSFATTYDVVIPASGVAPSS